MATSWLGDAFGSLFGAAPESIQQRAPNITPTPPGGYGGGSLAGLLDPRGIREQAFYSGLGALSQGLLAAGMRRPAGSPSPLPQAFGAFQPAYQGALQSGYQTAGAEQQFRQREAAERTRLEREQAWQTALQAATPAERTLMQQMGPDQWGQMQGNVQAALRRPTAVGPGHSLVIPQTNQTIASVPPTPPEPRLVGSATEGYHWVYPPTPGADGQSPAPGGAQPPAVGGAPPGGAPSGQPAAPGGPRVALPIRNNNWLAMSPGGPPPGSPPGTPPPVAQYETPEIGIAVASQNLDRLFPSGTVTPRQLVQMWAQGPNYDPARVAPGIRASVENYGTAVARAAGASNPDQPINLRDPAVRQRVMLAMGHFETGGLPQGADAVIARGIEIAAQPGARFTPTMPRQAAPPQAAPPQGTAPPPARPGGPRTVEAIPPRPVDPRLAPGNSVDAHFINTYRELEALRAAGTPFTRQQQFDYDMARRHLMQPRSTYNERGELVVINPLGLPEMGGAPSAAPTAPGAAAPAVPAPAAPATAAPPPPARPAGPTATVTPTRTREQPEPVARAMLANAANISQVDTAIDALNAHPQAVGFLRGHIGRVPWVGNPLINTQDPQGVAARSAIGALSGLRIHTMSGANVTASEEPRLAQYIPAAGDSPEVVRTKLLQFRTEYQAILRGDYEAYGPANREQNYQRLEPIERALQRRHANVTPEQISTMPLASVVEIASDAELWNSLSQEVRDAISERSRRR